MVGLKMVSIPQGRPYLWFVLICGVTGFIMLLSGIVLANAELMSLGALWLIGAFSAYLFFYVKSEHR